MLDFSDFSDDELTNTNRNNTAYNKPTNPSPRQDQAEIAEVITDADRSGIGRHANHCNI